MESTRRALIVSYGASVIIDIKSVVFYNRRQPNRNLTGDIDMNAYNEDFWKALDALVNTSEIVIDRPKGTVHSHEPPRIDVFPKIKWNTALDFGLLHIDISPCVVIE